MFLFLELFLLCFTFYVHNLLLSTDASICQFEWSVEILFPSLSFIIVAVSISSMYGSNSKSSCKMEFKMFWYKKLISMHNFSITSIFSELFEDPHLLKTISYIVIICVSPIKCNWENLKIVLTYISDLSVWLLPSWHSKSPSCIFFFGWV